MAREWEYTVSISNGIRRYRRDDENKVREGLTWALVRSCPTEGGETFYHSIVESPEVFDTLDEAKQDALEKLSILRCPLNQPLDKAIRWMLDG